MKNDAEVIGTARIAARRRAVRLDRSRARRRIAIGIALAGAVTYGVTSLTGSSVFMLERIEVAGQTSVPSDRIIAASGLRIGSSALGLDLDAAAAAVLALPEIGDARVERVGSLGVRIVVTDRRPALEVRAGDESYFLDASGRVLAAPASRSLLPVVRAASTIDGAPTLDKATIDMVTSFWRRAGRLRRSIVEITVQSKALTFRVGDTIVVIGSLDRLRAKLGVVDAIRRRANANDQRVTFIDVRAPQRPSARVA